MSGWILSIVTFLPLAIRAALSVVGGYVGVPEALGGHNRFERFLEPVFREGARNMLVVAEHGHSEELVLTTMSVIAAGLGFALAWLFYVRRPDLPQLAAQKLGGLYRTVFNKYYVDEIYRALFVEPLVAVSTTLFWRGVDVTTIDGAVNEGAASAQRVGDQVRRMQSGNIRSYAGWLAAGAAAVAVYMIVAGVRW